MLLRGLTWLVLCQLLGTALSVLLLPMLPGPIIGLLLMFALLLVQGRVSEPLAEASSTLLRYLPLLLVPTAVSVVLYLDLLGKDLWAVIATMLLSLVISCLFTGWLMQRLIERQGQREEQP
jgi:putative effector of murein hydrolase LrgA (UPF0299 family)